MLKGSTFSSLSIPLVLCSVCLNQGSLLDQIRMHHVKEYNHHGRTECKEIEERSSAAHSVGRYCIEHSKHSHHKAQALLIDQWNCSIFPNHLQKGGQLDHSIIG